MQKQPLAAGTALELAVALEFTVSRVAHDGQAPPGALHAQLMAAARVRLELKQREPGLLRFSRTSRMVHSAGMLPPSIVRM